MTDELKTLVPNEPITVTIDGAPREIDVRPFKFRDLPAATAMVAKYFTAFEGLAQQDTLDLQLASTLIPSLLLDMGDDLFRLIGWCTPLTVEEMGGLDADEGIELVMKVIEVNMDFFTRKVAPRLKAIQGVMGQSGAK